MMWYVYAAGGQCVACVTSEQEARQLAGLIQGYYRPAAIITFDSCRFRGMGV